MQHVLLRLCQFCASCASFVPVFCTNWHNLNIGISSKTIFCASAPLFSINCARKKYIYPVFFYIEKFSIFSGTTGTKSDSVEIQSETACQLCFFNWHKTGTNPLKLAQIPRLHPFSENIRRTKIAIRPRRGVDDSPSSPTSTTGLSLAER